MSTILIVMHFIIGTFIEIIHAGEEAQLQEFVRCRRGGGAEIGGSDI